MSLSPARRWLREPAVHFAAIGIGLFALHARVARSPANHRIVVSPSFIEALRQDQARRTGKPPTPEETRGLVDRFIDEEVLYREALGLGLDQGDLIVRRRLVQKMEFLTRDTMPGAAPTDAELQAYLDAHPEGYRRNGATSFRHVFLSRDRRGDAGQGAEELLSALRAGADPALLGDPFLQGGAWSRRTDQQIAAGFGPAFAAALESAPEGVWSGPIRSSYGEHLVRVEERAPGGTAALSAVRARVQEDYLAARRDAEDREATRRLRERYQIQVEGP